MLNTNKLLSVVIPVYNVQDYLRATIDCIIYQTYNNWELILVDDGSTDDSLKIALEYSNNDSRISVYQRSFTPKGAPMCRNIGMKHAKGEYIVFLDSDDIIAPYCFEQRIRYIEEHDCDFAVFPMMGFYQTIFDAVGVVYGYKPKDDHVFSLLARDLPFVVATNIYKTKALRKENIVWDTRFRSYQDSDYNLQVIHAGLSYQVSNLLPDYFYRLSAQNSICKKLSTVASCESQVLFLEKQVSIYWQDKRYKKALLICAAQIFRNILLADNNMVVIEDFLKSDIFSKKIILRNKLRIVRYMSSVINSEQFDNILQLLFCPCFFLRFKLYFRKSQVKKLLFEELKQKYINEVSETDQAALQAML